MIVMSCCTMYYVSIGSGEVVHGGVVGWGEVVYGGVVGWGEVVYGGVVGWGEVFDIGTHISNIDLVMLMYNVTYNSYCTMLLSGLGSSTVDQVLKYTKYSTCIPSTSTGQVLIF